ncbi:hypothetical protein VKT23_018575 [Stygiomarasmius scandens]|uniref:Uncharacterized protein n=1 Tax=Marasmiellus scandens TaxID=2682957 RepID=A0ABR1IP35_9AGAR
MPANQEVARQMAHATWHFKRGEYLTASAICTEAIELDKTNVALLLKRAACRQSLDQHIAAAYDGFKAIELDPANTKAHAIVALARDALKQPWLSVNSWADAIVTLSKDIHTLDEATRKARRDQVISDAVKDLFRTCKPTKSKKHSLGYHRALEDSIYAVLHPRRKAFDYQGLHRCHPQPWLSAFSARLNPNYPVPMDKSCVEYVCMAYEEVRKAADMLSGEMTDEHLEVGECTHRYHYPIPAVEPITNAILYDHRVMRDFEQDPFLSQSAIEQAKEEARLAGISSWLNIDNFDKIKKYAHKRLKRDGWKGDGSWKTGLGNALNIAARYWILTGYFKDSEANLNEVRKAVKLVKWAQKEWKDVWKSEGIPVLDPGFLRLLLTRLLYALFVRHSALKNQKPSAARPFCKELGEVADELLQNIELNSSEYDGRNGLDNLIYFDYPKGQALCMKAFSLYQDSIVTKNKQDKERLKKESLAMYIACAECYPIDEEHHTWYLQVALGKTIEPVFAPADETYRLLQRIKRALPSMMQIWTFSLAEQIKIENYEFVIDLDEKIRGVMERANLEPEQLTGKSVKIMHNLSFLFGFLGMSVQIV